MSEASSAPGSLCGRAVAYLKASVVQQQLGKELSLSRDDSPVLDPLDDSLLVAYIVDEGDRFQYVQHRHLRQEGFSESKLREVGRANLQAIAQSLEVRAVGPGVFGAFAGGNFEASLILLDGLWDIGMRHVVAHDFVACIPARDVLAFTDSESREGIEALRKIVERVSADGDHLLTKSLYRRRNGAWEKLE